MSSLASGPALENDSWWGMRQVFCDRKATDATAVPNLLRFEWASTAGGIQQAKVQGVFFDLLTSADLRRLK